MHSKTASDNHYQTKAKETFDYCMFLSSKFSAMTPECMIEMAHLHMKHLGSFSFTSFSNRFIIPQPSTLITALTDVKQ